MEIEPIPSIDGAAVSPALDTPLVEYLRQLHASPAQIALAEAQAEAAETVEQRAASGDPLALEELARDEASHLPADQPIPKRLHGEHLPGDHGVHEDGKGDAIDIYD